tara:strand:+ start:11929 stop:12906 length:978 start_codon:yes stop_codon:yes gene_type:complete
MASIPEDGTNIENALGQAEAINLLLNRENTPVQASEDVQESEDTQEVSTQESETETEEVVQDQTEAVAEEEESEQYDEESEEEEVAVYLAKVDGEEVEVTADDLIKSYQLEQTAQKRLREAAEERKKIQSDAQQVEAERKYYAENLALLQEALRQYQTGDRTEEQWSELYREDPMLYMKEKEDVRDRQAKQQALQQEQYALQQRQLQEEQAKLLERIPEWKDAQVANKERDSIVTYAKRFGFNDQEIAATADSRVVDLLRRAYLYDELMAKRPTATKKVKKAPKMIKAGKPKGKINVSEQNRKTAFDKLAKSGRKEDAISYLLTK